MFIATEKSYNKRALKSESDIYNMKINYQIEPSKLKKTQAIFCDVDGTLINSKLEIDSFTKKEIMEFKDKTPFILTSGRTYKALKSYHDQLKLSTPYITLNGAYVIDSNNKVISSTPIEDKVKSELLFFLYREFSSYTIIVFSLDKWYSNSMDNEYIRNEIDIVHFLPDQIYTDYHDIYNMIANKILFIGPEEACNKVTEGGKRFQKDLYVIHNSKNYVEFFSRKASKGTAIKKYCSLLGYDPDYVLGIGDSMIDHTMLEICGFKASPMNANEEIKRISNIHLPSNNDNAVGHLLEDIKNQFQSE